MTNKYSFNGALVFTLSSVNDPKWSEGTNLSDFWSALSLDYDLAYDSTIPKDVLLATTVLTMINNELYYNDWFVYSNSDLIDADAKLLIAYTFFKNYVKAKHTYMNLADLLVLRETLIADLSVTRTSTSAGTMNQGASVSIGKLNETPQSGNININSDTYLSSISKNTTDARTDSTSGSSSESTLDNERLLEILNGTINSTLNNFLSMILENCEL